jgi:hypothetical protein
MIQKDFFLHLVAQFVKDIKGSVNGRDSSLVEDQIVLGKIPIDYLFTPSFGEHPFFLKTNDFQWIEKSVS